MPLLLAVLAAIVAVVGGAASGRRRSRSVDADDERAPTPRSRRRKTRRVGRWWVGATLLILAMLTVSLLAHDYTSVTDSGEQVRGDGQRALPIGTGTVLELRDDGVRSVRPPVKHVALTFDDGPDPTWTPAILDVLAEEHVPGTFFVIGENVVRHPGLARRVLAQGGDLGVHTYRHLDISNQDPAALQRDLRLTQLAIVGATGHRTGLFRPPFITVLEGVGLRRYLALHSVGASGYLTVLADRDSEDWRRPGVDTIVRAALPEHDAGAVIELHDGGGDRSQTVAALRIVIDELRSRGYHFDTISRLAGLDPHAVMPSAGVAEEVWGRWFVHSARAVDVVDVTFLALVVLATLLSVFRVVVGFVGAHRGGRVPFAVGAGPRSVSVLVAAYNEERRLPPTLVALTQDLDTPVQVVVVDDGSIDATADVAARSPSIWSAFPMAARRVRSPRGSNAVRARSW